MSCRPCLSYSILPIDLLFTLSLHEPFALPRKLIVEFVHSTESVVVVQVVPCRGSDPEPQLELQPLNKSINT